MKAIVFNSPNSITIEEFQLTDCGPNEIIAETIFSFVSPGTELRILEGKNESSGQFPLIPGYSWVGKILETGSDVKGWHEGELVTGRNPLPLNGINQLWGGQASHHRCDIRGYDCVLKLPYDADPWEYIITEVAAISWRGVSIAYPAKGETAVVIGQGMIGSFAAKWLLYHGARVIVADLQKNRLQLATKWGITGIINASENDTYEKIMTLCADGADIVVECSGSISGVQLAGKIIRQPIQRTLNTAYSVEMLKSNALNWPRIVFLASYKKNIDINPREFMPTEGTVVLNPGDRTVMDRLAVIDRIREKVVDVSDFANKAVPFTDASNAYKDIRDNPDKVCSLVFKWQ